MGVYAEATAQKYGFTRQQQDDFAIASLERAQTAIGSGAFTAEMIKVNETTTDENLGKAKPEKTPQLKQLLPKMVRSSQPMPVSFLMAQQRCY